MKKQWRYEKKYFINYSEYEYARRRLLELTKQDENTIEKKGYNVRSLYFDDMYNTAYREKEDGVEVRHKYRIRIYNGSDKMIRLEKKEKQGEFNHKQSLIITKEEFYKIINNENIDFLLNSQKSIGRAFYIEIKTKLLKPAVIVEYEREAFIIHEGNVRITFDKQLNAGIGTYDIFDESMIHINVMEPNQVILEVKYDNFCPKIVSKALNLSRNTRSSYSKFIYCMNAMRQANFRGNII